MAYLEKVTPRQCVEGFCAAYATHILHNNWNAIVGYYCERHACGHLDELNALEQRIYERYRDAGIAMPMHRGSES